ncbi:MAG: AMP-binding protein [Bacteroidales bacterium]|jgi:long-chain acyl-CoA synthetase|nr:AMP-binding protein [Bacteroidales bacterium]OQC02685.1 MAG: Long-chain-fatty-acid--CoA ligase FadD15 [Bacteroidetes bacterium ADurb.Bin090]MBP8981406.1 AMP-binding protein [Bacteroidales bacterium]NLV39097.1 AMP-binding protein [Bacteroidales bacterium]HOD25848.1 AMP-binding protein [Bacteroidales bacterium]
MKKKTIVDLFEESCAKYAQNVFLWERDTEFRPTTFAETQKEVYRFGAGLLAMGLKKDEKVALLSEGRNKWMIGELGILYTGAVNVPLSIKLQSGSDLVFRINHSDSRFILVSGTQLPKVREIMDQMPLIEKVIVMDEDITLQDKELYFEDVCKMGDKFNKKHPGKLLEIAQSVQGDDYANISYTSGTTADPKGILLTHRNYTANVEQSRSRADIPPHYRMLMILPLDHCFAHVTCFYVFMSCGASIATVPVGKTALESLRNIPLSIQEVKPDLMMSVPALAKSFKASVEKGVAAKGPAVQKLFDFAMKVAVAYNKEGYNKGTGGTFVLKPLVKLFDKILFSKLRDALGGNMKFFIGGGALLDIDMQKFWYAIGIPMFQGYGLSEATPVISTNFFTKHKLGSSGVPVIPLELTIRDEKGNILPTGQKGEIVIKGENVMAGYWKNPTATAETIKDGWLYTGDMGAMDEDGFLYVYGRFKSLLIASDGEKYSPEGIEESLVTLSPHIDQVVLYNNQSPYTVALIVVNKELLKKDVPSYDSLEGKKQALKLIQQEINAFKQGGVHEGMFPERWLPATFAVLPEAFTEQNKLLNSTMKIVRGKVEERYSDRIEHMMTAAGKDIFNEKNIEALRQQLM